MTPDERAFLRERPKDRSPLPWPDIAVPIAGKTMIRLVINTMGVVARGGGVV
jgi:hypothetical protein